jgi:hypothetical protein
VVCHTDAVAAGTMAAATVGAARMPLRRMVACLSILLAVVVGGAFGQIGLTGTADASRPLKAPRTTAAQDTKFFTGVAVADPALASYEQKQGNVALRALLTDGSAFCALLTRSGGLDDALVEEATGARSTESQTHLPLSVTTFNTIEGVALLTLCPSEQKLLPASVRTKIHNLGKSLAKRPG